MTGAARLGSSTANGVFHDAELPVARRVEQRREILQAHPGVFTDAEDVAAFLGRIDFPASRRWVLAVNPKCANTSVKRLLFRLEYGTELTAAYHSPFDINTDGPAQRLSVASVFRNLDVTAGATAILDGALRLTTARHPVPRAVSMFRYLCRSNLDGHVMFANDRLRMNAAVGFNWTRDANTPTGLLKFLDYVALSYEQSPLTRIDFHWRRQVDTVRPTVFRPMLVGLVGQMDRFYRDLATRLDAPEEMTLSALDRPASNRNDADGSIEALLTPEAESRIAEIYAADLDWLGLQSDEWRRGPEGSTPTPKRPPLLRRLFPRG